MAATSVGGPECSGSSQVVEQIVLLVCRVHVDKYVGTWSLQTLGALMAPRQLIAGPPAIPRQA